MTKRIVVTGGAGYIGSHTLLDLLSLGHQVCVLDNFTNGSPEALSRVQKLAGREVVSHQVDVRDQHALDGVFGSFKPDAVIHFAGLKAVGEGEEQPVAYYDVNVGGTINVLKAMAASSCRTIIFSSSATVYGEPDYLPIDEAHHCRPMGVYGRTKRMAEEVLIDWAKATTDASAIILRYFNPVGAHESGDLGEDPKDIPNNLMPFIAQVAVGLRERLSIFGGDYATRDGTGLRDYIHVLDLARAHVAAFDYACRKPTGADIFNVGSGGGVTVHEMLIAYGRACGRSLPFEVMPRRAGDIPSSVANPTKAGRLLRWEARQTLDQMCRSSWKWQSQNPNGYRGVAP
ncbi:UDP-glucose 4-epimerase [Methylobacterium bullatum]|uniref:UDP-glucose 4-epimerase n=1 Tax=Methylobacterium bullatum TaxID=570505 RepID=A0A679JD17_9HYPH|nr:UDP-glucose 4-epimerase [Methylobacterium bullatum]